MALTLDMLVALYTKSKVKVNLIYKRPGGSIDYCYLDPSRDLLYNYTGRIWGGSEVLPVFRALKESSKEYYYTFYKQQNNVKIMVKLKDIDFQNKNKAEMLKLIYDEN